MNFTKCFLFLPDDHILFLYLLNVIDYINQIFSIKTPLHYWNKPQMVMMNGLFYILLPTILEIFWGFFFLIFYSNFFSNIVLRTFT